MSNESDLAHESRVIARLMVEPKAPVIFEERDAAKLRKAADELESLYAALDQCSRLAYSAVRAEREAIMGVLNSERQRVPRIGEYYAGYREALRNLEAAIRARSAPS